MTFDFLNPDYAEVFRRRLVMLQRMRADSSVLPVLRSFYKLHPWQFIEDWGMTYDPRNVERGLPATIPFIPFERQTELMKWIVLDRWQQSKDGLVPKSRDTGASWCAIALSCTLCLFYPGMAIGFGSRKEEYVDRLDSPKSLFYKARVFMENLPPEFRGSWTRAKHGVFMRITFPESGSVMTGEAGDNIGRGDRCGIYFVDESAHLERPETAEEALSATTNCRIDMSSVKGMNNPFAQKAHSWPEDAIFPMHWRHDPRKTEAWYEGLKATKSPAVIAQEYDINYSASVEGVVIPNEWVQAAIDAHIKLGIEPTGARRGALDVADQGIDLNAYAGAYGILLDFLDTWSGKDGDIYDTTERAFQISDELGCGSFRFDSDGLGAGVRGDSRKINEARARKLQVTPFRGSAAVVNPDARIPSVEELTKDKEERTNRDYFKNLKAQSWWHLRLRFLRTYRAVKLGHPVTDPDGLISISSKLPRLTQLVSELSQPTYGQDVTGKLLIDKQPEGARSPNCADAVMILFAPAERAPRSIFD